MRIRIIEAGSDRFNLVQNILPTKDKDELLLSFGEELLEEGGEML